MTLMLENGINVVEMALMLGKGHKCWKNGINVGYLALMLYKV